jgi:hypothetical protein
MNTCCKIAHVPNKKTAACLIESECEKVAKAFESPLELFKYLGLPRPYKDKT